MLNLGWWCSGDAGISRPLSFANWSGGYASAACNRFQASRTESVAHAVRTTRRGCDGRVPTLGCRLTPSHRSRALRNIFCRRLDFAVEPGDTERHGPVRMFNSCEGLQDHHAETVLSQRYA